MRENLIAKVTHSGMSEQEYTDAIDSVDAYLGTLSNVINAEKGNLLTATHGIEDLYDDYA
jgi:bisphosphoglycerate-independent phosphoglycerate mutase (AlkP superfamily)